MFTLEEIQKLLKDIEELKNNLNTLISIKGFNLQDPEVIKASQTLNSVISKYNNIIKKELDQY